MSSVRCADRGEKRFFTLGKFASNRYAIKGFGSSVSSSENGEK